MESNSIRDFVALSDVTLHQADCKGASVCGENSFLFDPASVIPTWLTNVLSGFSAVAT